jgi:hypothetical protein
MRGIRVQDLGARTRDREEASDVSSCAIFFACTCVWSRKYASALVWRMFVCVCVGGWVGGWVGWCVGGWVHGNK